MDSDNKRFDNKRISLQNVNIKRTKNLLIPFLIISFFLVFVIPVHDAAAVITLQADAPSHNKGDVAYFFVTDPSFAGNGNDHDKITVRLSSTTDPTGITLQLDEVDPLCLPGSGILCTPADSGIFSNNGTIFTVGSGFFTMGSTIHVKWTDPAQNTSPGVDTIGGPFSIMSLIPTTFDLSPPFPDSTSPSVLTETGGNTGVFTDDVQLTSGGTSGQLLHATQGEFIKVVLPDGNVNNTWVGPTHDPTVGILPAKQGDQITLSYGGVSSVVTGLNQTIGGGGGTGGLTPPGLVLDALGGSAFIVSPPSFGGGLIHYSDGLTIAKPNEKQIFDISKYFQDVENQVLVTGQPVNMTFKMSDPYNINAIIHSGLYIIPSGTDMITPNSVASIVYDKNSQLEINDPTNLLSDVSVTPYADGTFQYFSFYFVPTRSYEKMSFLDRTWNDHKYSTDVIFHDAGVPQTKTNVLPTGFTKYDNYHDMIAMIENEGFKKPQILSHIHSTTDVFPSNEGGYVYWLYDSIKHAATLVVTDKEENTLYSFTQPLVQNEITPKGDYGFMTFTTKQLNREDVDGEQKVMEQEAIKALATKLTLDGYHQENGIWIK